jgi:NitT/TauT family transport system substrate-binding protein
MSRRAYSVLGIHRLGGLIGSVALLFATVAGCSSGSGSSATADAGGTGEPVVLKVQQYPGLLQELAVDVGIEEGFFERHGVKIEIVNISSGTAAATAGANGSVDAFFQAPTFVMGFNAKNPSQQMVQLSNIFDGPQYDLVGKSSVIDKCADATKPYPTPLNCLRGQKIGITALGSDNYNVMLGLLQSANLTEKDVQLVAVGVGAQQANAVRAGIVNYTLSVEPARTQLVDVLHIGKPLVSLKDDPSYADWEGEATFARASVVAGKAAAYKGYVAGLAEANAFIKDDANEDKVIADYAKYTTVAGPALEALVKAHKQSFTEVTRCSAIDSVGAWLVKTKQLTADQVPSCAEFIWSESPRT